MLRCSKTARTLILPRCRAITSSAALYSDRAITREQPLTKAKRKAARGGQNLSGRWVRLENSIREKTSLSKGLEAFAANDASLPNVHQQKSLPKPKSVPLFHGFIVPEEPKPPADDECCMSGCAVCVYDLYEESLEAYNEAVTGLRASLSTLGIPSAEWPAHIRPKTSEGNTPETRQPESRKSAIMDAFEEMERKLALKRNGSASNSVSDQPPRWRERQQLVAVKKAETRDSIWSELYESVRWVIFSGR